MKTFLFVLALSLVAVVPAASAKAPPAPPADATTKLLLKPDEVLRAVLSPNGQMIAVARQSGQTVVVTVSRWPEMTLVRKVQSGNVGPIDTVRWLDDTRLVIGTIGAITYQGNAFLVALPSMFIVPIGGGKAAQMPANFLATIEGDTDHLLVSACAEQLKNECVLEIRKVSTGAGAGTGDLVIKAPEPQSVVLSDDRGTVRFAMGWGKDGRSRSWVTGPDGKSWSLINEEAKSGVSVYPMGVAADGKSGFVQSQRADGTDAVERYDFATGTRAEILRDPESDPIGLVLAADTQEPIGAWFGNTQPKLRFWNPAHPHAALLQDAQRALPGKLLTLTSASRDGQRAVLLVAGDRDPGSFYVFDRASGKATLVAHSRPWLAEAKMAASREFTVRARDGLPLKGILTTPPGSTGKSLPTVVLVHGGPYDISDAWGFDDEVQILAQQGFAVVQVNFRGSGGYGKAFVDRGMRQWGKAMQDDVTDATRWAIAEGVSDPARVCIYGASYGAYAALMGAAREPDLYRCAAGYAGIYDLEKLYKWDNLRRTDLGMDFLHRAIGTDAAEMATSSPMLQAGRIKANVFLAHGFTDQISDLRFAKAMQKALNKTHKAKGDLVVYEWEGHGLLDPRNREDFYARLVAFLHVNLDAAPAAQPMADAH